jgi:hypothetical protein
MHLIAYTSRCLIQDARLQSELAIISHVCSRHNAAIGVTGVLICEGSRFVQLLEGDEATLRDLLEKISRDSRHDDIMILIDAPIRKREFPNWAMETFFLARPDLLNPVTLNSFRDIYSATFSLESKKFLDFIKTMLDSLDVFDITRSSSGVE